MAQVNILCHDEFGCINVFGFYTHEFTRGWALGSHAGLLLAAAVDSSGRGAFPLLGDSASKCMEAALFFLPPLGICLPPPPRPLRRQNGHWSLRILCPKCHGDKGRPGSFWPPSRPSSSVPCKAPGPASSSEVGRPVLLAVGPDSRSAPPSSSSPRRVVENTLSISLGLCK